MTAFQIVTVVLSALIAGGIVVLMTELRRLRSRSPYGPYWREHRYDHLHYLIDRAEAEAGVVLTWGAREMLSIPIIETVELRGGVSWDEVAESVRDIVRTMAEEPQRQQLPPSPRRDSVSVIRGFARRFCNIPPFCSRDEER